MPTPSTFSRCNNTNSSLRNVRRHRRQLSSRSPKWIPQASLIIITLCRQHGRQCSTPQPTDVSASYPASCIQNSPIPTTQDSSSTSNARTISRLCYFGTPKLSHVQQVLLVLLWHMSQTPLTFVRHLKCATQAVLLQYVLVRHNVQYSEQVLHNTYALNYLKNSIF
jgi:hypothetical protein